MNQQGNVLFLILIAVALFAALSYAITSSTRGGGQSSITEADRAAASSIVQFFSSVDTALTRLRTAGGFRAEDISFEYNYKQFDGTYIPTMFTNTNCTSSACKIFDPAGGGAVPVIFEQYGVQNPTGAASGWYASGYFGVKMMQWPNAGTSANDVVLMVAQIKPGICNAMNSLMGVVNTPTGGGTYLSAVPVSSWDNAGQTIAIYPEEVSGKHSVATNTWGTGAGSACNIIHLLLAR